MSNRSLLIITIVLLSIIAVCLIAFLVMALTGKYRGFSIGIFESGNNEAVFEESYEEALVNSFEVKSEAGDINIEPSQDEKIKVVVYGKNQDDVKVSFNEGNLKIDVKQPRRVMIFGTYMNKITIYIPQSYSKELNIKANYGDIDIGSLENSIMNVENDCGSIKIQNLDIKEDSNIESDLGDIKIEKTSDIYIDAKVDLGDIKVNENNRHSEITLKAKNSCGDIKINY